MLKGLEISEITLSQAQQDNEVFRFDAEYFGKEALAVIARMQDYGPDVLSSIATITDGIHTSLPFVDDGDVKVLSAKHPKENFIDRSLFETISAAFHAKNPRTALRENDVLISTVGTIGNSAVVTSDLLPANSDRHIGIVRLHKGTVSPYFLSTFLLGRFGRVQTWRETTGNVQPNLFISKIGKLLLPRVSDNFEKTVTQCVIQAYQLRAESGQNLEQTEATLLRALGLEDWKAPEPLSYVRSSRDAFGAGRLDAQYFHPAKTEALAKLNALSNCTVGDCFNSVRELWQPDNDSGPHTVRNYDLTDALNPFLDGAKEPSHRTTIASTKKAIRGGDLVVSRLRSYLREIALVQPGDGLPMVASTEYIVLRPKQTGGVPVEALMIFLRSALPQLVFKWSQDGSAHPRFDEKELLRLPLPDVLIQHSDDYVDAVRAVIAKRKRATQLLNAAKRAVEIAIEQNEKAAMAYLESNA